MNDIHSIILTSILLASAVFLNACSKQEKTEAHKNNVITTNELMDSGLTSSYTTNLEGISDTTINANIKAAIQSIPEMEVFSIKIDTTDGVVTLNGSVDSVESKHNIQNIANSVQGVKHTNNQLAIKPVK